jgi:hypothetical protein
MDLDSLGRYLPFYLTQPQKEGLMEEIKRFPAGYGYYRDNGAGVIQGDGIADLKIFNYQSGSSKKVHGIILSNSCDIDPTNGRLFSGKAIFAPLIKLSSYVEIIGKANGATSQSIATHTLALKKQEITSLFFLPKGGQLSEDYVAMLGEAHSIPMSELQTVSVQSHKFSLSLFGFYLFIFKLSVHFCRMHEGLPRA